MESRKQVNSTPDNSSLENGVVIGLNGSINSMVAAYLLKIQKIDLVAVTIIPSWLENRGDLSQSLSCNLNQNKIDSVRDFCKKLGIPLHIIKMNEEFAETVIESWISSSLTAQANNACLNCHDLRLKILFEKANALGLEKVATGHIAKIFHHELSDSFIVHSSNDESNDQSHFISRLPQSMLGNLILPLSDLMQKEIFKLAENFGFSENQSNSNKTSCFNDIFSKEYMNKSIPVEFKKKGDVKNTLNEKMGEHTGVLNYEYAKVVKLSNNTSGGENYFANFSLAENKMTIASESYFIHKEFFLHQCLISPETPWYEPMKVVLKFNASNWKEAIIYPKNFSSAWVELSEECKIKQGELVYVFRKKGKNAKLLLSGYIKFFGKSNPEVEVSQNGQKINNNFNL